MKVDPASSHVTIQVGKGGAFGFAGHEHEVVASALGGEIRLDGDGLAKSSVTLAFDAARLRVTARGEPEKDVPEVQRIMLSAQVLGVKKFPTIAFKSRSVTVTQRPGADATVVTAGDWTLHGRLDRSRFPRVSRPERGKWPRKALSK